tara:strand:+ start:271 stop:1914 length:1644 start_codon:yes stop_codon:yes gene_type:complete
VRQIYYLKLLLKIRNMKKLLLLFCTFQFISNDILAQIQVNGQVDNTEFPYIEFVLQSRDPDELSLGDFQFFENIDGNKVELDSINFDLLEDTVDYSTKNKCVLIMIEALHHRDRFEQVKTFYNAVGNSINDIVNKGDKVKIIAFALTNRSSNLLEDVTSRFTDDIDEIKSDLDSYKIEYSEFTNKPVANITSALEKGINLLVEQDNTFSKSILLLSEERNNKYDQLTANDITELAKSKNIVINTVKYNREKYIQHSMPTLAKETYGISEKLSLSSGELNRVNVQKVEEAENIIIDILNHCVQRSSGNEYLVGVNLLDDTKNGQENVLTVVQVDSKNKTTILYTASGNWFFAQFQKNLYLALGLSFLLILILVYLIWLFVDINKNKKLAFEQSEKRRNKIENEQESEILKQKQEILAMREKQAQKEKSDQLLEQNALKKIEEKKLISQMKRLGAFPILKYSDDNNSAQYEINIPVTTVGRDEKSNIICIPNKNISRNHFSIIFSNDKYSIIDNKSTNGIIINGYKLNNSQLKNGDIIEIADVTFTFYI